jgi:hypothetical protein
MPTDFAKSIADLPTHGIGLCCLYFPKVNTIAFRRVLDNRPWKIKPIVSQMQKGRASYRWQGLYDACSDVEVRLLINTGALEDKLYWHFSDLRKSVMGWFRENTDVSVLLDTDNQALENDLEDVWRFVLEHYAGEGSITAWPGFGLPSELPYEKLEVTAKGLIHPKQLPSLEEAFAPIANQYGLELVVQPKAK